MSTEYITGLSNGVSALAGNMEEIITGNLTSFMLLFGVIAGFTLILKFSRRILGR